jgi:tetratricopeptide (TPR) repeat protein
MGSAAVAYARAGALERAQVMTEQMKKKVKFTENGELQLLKVLIEVAEIMKDDEIALGSMERTVQVDPSDIDMRFSLAYKHSECGNNDLSLLHYLRIPPHERKAVTWNNLGVAFDQFLLAGKSVDAYRRAEALGETLAMSNLASKLISAGFLAEAQEHCDRALSVNNYHKNLTHTLSKLREVPDDENKREAELLLASKPKSEFYQEFGRAICESYPNELAGDWQGPDCILKLTLSAGQFEAVGSYERSANALATAFGTATSSTHHRVEYRGTASGHAIETQVTRTPVGASPAASSLLGSSGNETTALLTLADDGNEINVMERSSKTALRYYRLKRIRIDKHEA